MKSKKPSKLLWVLPIIAIIIFAYLGGTFQDIATPFSDTISYDNFDSGFDSSKWDYIQNSPSSQVSRIDVGITVENGLLRFGDGCLAANRYNECVQAYGDRIISSKIFKDIYVKIDAKGKTGKVCFGTNEIKCVPLGQQVCRDVGGCEYIINTPLIEILPSKLREGEGWIFVDGREYSTFVPADVGEYRIVFVSSPYGTYNFAIDRVGYTIPWNCNIGTNQGFIRQTYSANQIIAINTLAKEPRKFCLSQPARILRNGNLISDAEIYDRIAKGGSYTVRDNERIDIFYIYDMFDCSVGEYYDHSSKTCIPLEQLQFSCTNGEFNQNLDGCTVEPEIVEVLKEVITETEVIKEIVKETICPEGYTKELFQGSEVCLTSNPDVVQIEGESTSNIVAFGLSAKKLGFLGFILGSLIVVIIYFIAKRKK